ncbi:hypothetical protein D3C71_926970 [compost metagenome]
MAAELVFTVGHAGGGGRVGDAVQARNRAQSHADGAGVHVQQVRNQFGVFGVGQGCADDPRLAVMQRAHGVVEVGETAGAGLQRGHAFLITAQGVADLHANAAAAEVADQGIVTGDFRGNGDHPDRCERQVRFDFGHQRGVGEVGLRAEFAGVDVGAFEVHAEHPGAALWPLFIEFADGFEDVGDFFARRRHGGGQQRRGAEAHVGSGDGFEGGRAFHDVFAATAVNVQVDETRQQIRQVVVYRIAGHAFDGLDFAVGVDQSAANPAVGGEDVVFGHVGISVFYLRSSATKS